MRSKSDQQGRLLELIGQVYDAALDEQLWSGLAPRIAETFESTSTAVQVRNPGKGTVDLLAVTQNVAEAPHGEYETYYAERDLWVQRAAKFGMSRIVASKDLISDQELERSEFYNGWCRSVRIHYLVGAILPVANGEIAAIGIHRPRGSENYDERDTARVAQFLPHLQRALQIRQRLTDPALERQAGLEAMERTATATLVATREGRVLYANQEAERLLREGDAIRIVGGRLATSERSAAERLTGFIRGAVDAASGHGGTHGGTLSVARANRLPLTVLVAPFRPAREALGAPLPAAILFLRDPEGPTPRTIALQGLFGLTPAEANIAAALGDGKSVDDIITNFGISLNTARTHLKTIFAKTNTNRQGQLVALILRSVAVLVQR